MLTKNETAQLLADAHFQLDQGVKQIFRILEKDESNNLRPLKLLEINPSTTEVGISPVSMTADPARDVYYASIIVEISPGEFDRLKRGDLKLPHDWTLGPELFPRATMTRSAS